MLRFAVTLLGCRVTQKYHGNGPKNNLNLTHYRPAIPFGNRKKLEDLSSSVLSQFKIYHPSRNLKFIDSCIFQSLQFRIFVEKVLPISLKLNFTPNTLGCCGLTQYMKHSELNPLPPSDAVRKQEKNILKDLSSSVLSQLKIYHPSGNLIFIDSCIFQSLQFRILIEKVLPISLKLNFTPNTLGCCGLILPTRGHR